MNNIEELEIHLKCMIEENQKALKKFPHIKEYITGKISAYKNILQYVQHLKNSRD